MTDTKNVPSDGRIVVDFDQHSPDYQARSAEISHELRGKCPVTWSENYGGFWVVTGLDEVGEMYKHPDLFSAVKDPARFSSCAQSVSVASGDRTVGTARSRLHACLY
jgi:hypothetical protein